MDVVKTSDCWGRWCIASGNGDGVSQVVMVVDSGAAMVVHPTWWFCVVGCGGGGGSLRVVVVVVRCGFWATTVTI